MNEESSCVRINVTPPLGSETFCRIFIFDLVAWENIHVKIWWIRIYNLYYFFHDGLKIDQDLPFLYEDNFARDKIKNRNSAECLWSLPCEPVDKTYPVNGHLKKNRGLLNANWKKNSDFGRIKLRFFKYIIGVILGHNKKE